MTDWESGQATVRRQIPLKPPGPKLAGGSRVSDVSAGFPRLQHYVTINKSNSQVGHVNDDIQSPWVKYVAIIFFFL